MNLHSLSNTPGARRSSLRVGRGRGNGRGKTCGKGHKGQMARKGHKRKPGFEGGQMRLVRRIPKRGFSNYTRLEYVPVNVSLLARIEEAQVTPESLLKCGAVQGKGIRIKVLGNGSIDRPVTVQAHAFSAAARTKIEAAGGTCEVLTSA